MPTSTLRHARGLPILVSVLLAACRPSAPPAQPAPVKLELRLARDTPAPGFTAMEDPIKGATIYVGPELVLGNDEVLDARDAEDGNGQLGIELTISEAGSEALRRVTAEHFGQRLAFIIDGKVVLAPMIREAIATRNPRIAGSFTAEEARRIARALSVR